eukprot:g1572.t1
MSGLDAGVIQSCSEDLGSNAIVQMTMPGANGTLCDTCCASCEARYGDDSCAETTTTEEPVTSTEAPLQCVNALDFVPNSPYNCSTAMSGLDAGVIQSCSEDLGSNAIVQMTMPGASGTLCDACCASCEARYGDDSCVEAATTEGPVTSTEAPEDSNATCLPRSPPSAPDFCLACLYGPSPACVGTVFEECTRACVQGNDNTSVLECELCETRINNASHMGLENVMAEVCAYEATRYTNPCYSPFPVEHLCPAAPECPDGWTSTLCQTEAPDDDALGCLRCQWSCEDPVVQCFQGYAWPQSACSKIEACRDSVCGELDLSSKQIGALPPNLLGDIEHVMTLSVASNLLTTIPAQTFTLSLLHVDLSDNPFEMISFHEFCPSHFLESLSLENAQVSRYLPDQSIECDGVNDGTLFSRLNTLNLRSNDLEDLPVGLFSSMRMLRDLDLRDNSFAMLPGPIVESGINSESRICEDTPDNPDGSPSWWSEGGCAVVAPILDTGVSCAANLSKTNVSVIVATTTDIQGTLCDYCCSTCQQLNDPCPILLQSLEILRLERNKLTSVSGGAFRGLVSLKELYLDSNRISTLVDVPYADNSNDARRRGRRTASGTNDTAFAGLGSLLVLSLADCELGPSIDVQTFEGLSGLEFLDLGGNAIVALQAGVFNATASLKTLILQRNRISFLESDVLSHLDQLTDVDLSNNLFVSFEADSFASIPLLATLDFASNQIESLHVSATLSTQIFSSLRTFNVANNRVTHISSDVIASLCSFGGGGLELSMMGNPSVCSCSSCTCVFFTESGDDESGAPSCVAKRNVTIGSSCGLNSRGCELLPDAFGSTVASASSTNTGGSIRNCGIDDGTRVSFSTEGGDFVIIDGLLPDNYGLEAGSLRLVIGDLSTSSESATNCYVDDGNDTSVGGGQLRCPTPPGTGVGNHLALLSRDFVVRTKIFEGCTFDYHSPRIDSVVGYDLEAGAPRSGNVTVTIQGANFGAQDSLIFVNGRQCLDTKHGTTNATTNASHRHVECTLPALAAPQPLVNSFILFQSNQFTTFDSFCYAKCGKNQYQSDNMYDSRSGDNVFLCDECPRSSFANELDAFSCTSCDIWYIGSEHCDAPMAAMALGLFILLGALFFVTLLACKYRKAKVVVRQQENALSAQRLELRTKVEDIAMLSSAWEIKWDEVKLVSPIATGAAGEVWKGTLRGRFTVAVKKIFNSATMSLTNDREIQFLQRVKHPRLVWFMGCGKMGPGSRSNSLYDKESESSKVGTTMSTMESSPGMDACIFIVLEYCESGDLGSYLHGPSSKNNDLTWKIILGLLADVAEGMSHIHLMHGSIHRDLKSPNVLLTFENGRRLRAKVADFGLAKTLRRERRRSSANSSSPISSPDIALSPTGRARAPKTKRRSTFFSALRKKGSATLAHVTTKGATVKRHRSSPIQRAKESLDEMQISRSTSGDKNRKARSKQSVFSQADSPAMMMTGLMGTCQWMAPEVSSITDRDLYAPRTYTKAVDVFSFAMIMYEALELRLPWSHENLRFANEILFGIESGKRPAIKNKSKSVPDGYDMHLEEVRKDVRKRLAKTSSDVTEDGGSDEFIGMTSKSDGARALADASAANLCYHNKNNTFDYGELGHAEGKVDPYDLGAEYRSMIGIPGGIDGKYADAVRTANRRAKTNMTLKEGSGSDEDTFETNSVYIYDTHQFPFTQAEECLQFHDDPAAVRPPFSPAYHDLESAFVSKGRVVSKSCPPNFVCGGVQF